MDNKNFLTSTFHEQIIMMINAIKEKEKPFDLTKLLTGTPLEKIQMMIESAEKEEEKKKSGYYLTAPFTEQLPFFIKQLQLKQHPPDISNILTGNISDYADLLQKSIADEDEKVKSGYYLTAPISQQIPFMLRQIEKQVEEERIQKLEEVKFYIQALENTKEYINHDLTNTPLNDKTEIDELLDRLSSILHKLEIKFKERDNLTK